MVSSLLVISTVMADLLCAMVPMSFHLSHTRKHTHKCVQELNFPTQNSLHFLHPHYIMITDGIKTHRGYRNTDKYKGGGLLVEHDGSAVSVFDEHPNEGDTNENIVGVVVLWEKNISKSSHNQLRRSVCRGLQVICN